MILSLAIPFGLFYTSGNKKQVLIAKRREGQGTTFTSTTEMILSLAVCLILVVVGTPYALTKGSIVGWILSIVGLIGIVGLVILSIASQWGERPTYDNFLTAIFLFFVCLGLFIGIPVGMNSHSFWLGISASLVGLFGEYVLGIFAGLWLQYLGWIATILNMLAALAVIILGFTTIILLLVLAL